MNFISFVVVILTGVGMYAAASFTARGLATGALCVGLAVGAGWLGRKSGRRMRLGVSPRSLSWIHPRRGAGSMQWAEVGAVIAREYGKDGSTAVCLVSRSGEAEEGFVLAAEDFGLPPAEADARLRGFVEQVMPLLPDDVVIDRAMKRKMAEWGLESGFER